MNRITHAIPALCLVVFSEPTLAANLLVTGSATYEISLDASKGNGQIAGMTGNLVATLRHDCNAYHTDFELLANIVGADGAEMPMTLRSKHVERGGTLDFDLVALLSEMEFDRGRGSATRTDAGLTVALTDPKTKTAQFGGNVLFPIAATEAVIAAAEAGQTLVEFSVYDGSAHGEEVWTMSVVISPTGEGQAEEEEALFESGLGFAGLQRWRMKFSYFLQRAAEDLVPVFSAQMVVYENGFAQAAVYDFGQFAMKSRLIEFKPIPPKPCEAE